MKNNELITIGTISIRRDERADIPEGEAYTIFIFRGDDDSEYEMCTAYSFDFDRIILYALQLKHEGINGNFAEYAARMLDLDAGW